MGSNPRVSDGEIRAFWGWFERHADRLAESLDDDMNLQEELDGRLAAFGVAWEVGPGSNAENALAVSPDGDPDLLPLTRRIVALAPKMKGWELHPARPARTPSLEFSIVSSRDAREIRIDCRSWRYVLTRSPDASLDIIVEQENLAGVEENDRYVAAVLLLDGLLGEEVRLSRIRWVEPVLHLDAARARSATPVSCLPDHLKKLSSRDTPST
jgi:hypothetical protein